MLSWLLAWLAIVVPSSLHATQYPDLYPENAAIEGACFPREEFDQRLAVCRSIILEMEAALRAGELDRRGIILLARAYEGLRDFISEHGSGSEAMAASRRQAELWELLLESEPDHPGMLFKLGYAHLDPYEAEAVFRRLVTVAPDDYLAWRSLALSILMQQAPESVDEAVAVYIQAYERWPVGDRLKLAFARHVVEELYGANRLDQIARFARRVQADYGAPAVLDELEMQWREGMAAEVFLAVAAERLPPICERGARLGETEHCLRGLAIAEEILAVHPHDLGVNDFLFDQYWTMRQECLFGVTGCDTDERLKTLADTRVALEPSSATRRFEQAMTRRDGERMALLKALVSDFEHAPSGAYYVLGTCLENNGYHEEAIAVFRKGLASASDDEYKGLLQSALMQTTEAPPSSEREHVAPLARRAIDCHCR